MAAWALGLSQPLAECQWELGGGQGEEEITSAPGKTIDFSLGKNVELLPGDSFQLALYLAANREADGASTCVVDLQRRGWSSLWKATAAGCRPSAP